MRFFDLKNVLKTWGFNRLSHLSISRKSRRCNEENLDNFATNDLPVFTSGQSLALDAVPGDASGKRVSVFFNLGQCLREIQMPG